jgi:hypothetical protein
VSANGNGKAIIPSNTMTIRDMGEAMARSGFFSDSRDAAQAIVKIQAGAELGFPPVASMTGVYIVKGKVSLSANLIAAAIKRSGKYNYRIREHTDTACELEFFEGSESVGSSRFTMQDASKAGLTSNSPTWKNFPRNMLFARCISNGAKWYCPDVFGGPIYTPDELGAEVNEDGEPLAEPPPPQRETPRREEPKQLPPGDKAALKKFVKVVRDWTGFKAEEKAELADAWNRIAQMHGLPDGKAITAENCGPLTEFCVEQMEQGIDFIKWANNGVHA